MDNRGSLNRTTWTIVIAAAIIALVLGVMVVGVAGAAPALKECPSGETITVAAPSASAPTTVSVTVAPPVNLKPAKDAVADSYHLHYFVDIDPATVVQAGQPVPTGNPKIIHSASTTQDLGALSPGKHTVWVVLADVSHMTCSPMVQGNASFDVAAAATLPLSGTGGSPGGGVPALVAGLLIAGLLTSGAGLVLRRPKSIA